MRGERQTEILTALTVSEPVVAWLTDQSFRFRVHSVFPRAINLRADQGPFLALLVESADDGPFACRLATPSFPAVGIGLPVDVRDRAISVGSLHVEWQSAKRWSPTLPPLERSCDSLAEVVGRLRRYDPNQPEGVEQHSDPSTRDPDFHDRLAMHATDCLVGLWRDDGTVNEAVRGLLGLGQGLTPAGDDYLLGVVAARRMLGEPAGVLEATVCNSLSRTTALSAAFLQAACNGYFAGHWHRLRDALSRGGLSEIQEALGRLQAYGATSGRDALTGWMSGLLMSLAPISGGSA